MKDLDFYQNCISELKEKKAYFDLCDGYDGWNYGFPLNGVFFSYEETVIIFEYVKKTFSFDIEEAIINHNGWDSILPPEIEDFFGKRVCQFIPFPSFIKITTEIPSEEDWKKYLFKNEEEFQKSMETKKVILEKNLK